MVEILTVIVITAVLVVALVVYIPSFINWTQQTSDKQTLTVLNDALTRWKTQGGSVNALTGGAPIRNVLARMQSPINWAGMTHQVMQPGKTYLGRSLSVKGSGTDYRFTRFGTFTNEPGGNSPETLGVGSDALVAMYTFNEGSGTTATDVSGNGRDGALQNGPAYVAGVNGGTALSFAATNSRVDCGSSSVFKFTGPFAIALWVRPTSADIAPTQATGFLGNAEWGGNSGHGYHLGWGGGNDDLLFYLEEPPGPTGAMLSNGSTPAGQWVHIACVFSGSSTSVYINGSLAATGTGIAPTSASYNLYLGYDYQGGWRLPKFTGCLDDVRIYNRALTAQEVQQVYNSPTH